MSTYGASETAPYQNTASYGGEGAMAASAGGYGGGPGADYYGTGIPPTTDTGFGSAGSKQVYGQWDTSTGLAEFNKNFMQGFDWGGFWKQFGQQLMKGGGKKRGGGGTAMVGSPPAAAVGNIPETQFPAQQRAAQRPQGGGGFGVVRPAERSEFGRLIAEVLGRSRG